MLIYWHGEETNLFELIEKGMEIFIYASPPHSLQSKPFLPSVESAPPRRRSSTCHRLFSASAERGPNAVTVDK